MTPIMKAFALAIFLVAPFSVMAAPLDRRQLAGEGAACNSILSGTDNAVGYGGEYALENTAGLISSAPKAGAPKVRRSLNRRQGDKLANGVAAVISAAGQPGVASYVASNGGSIDGDLTGDAATVGAQTGAFEESALEGAGRLVP